MNPHIQYPTSLASLIVNIRNNIHLIIQMTKREIITRYKGSILGILWIFVHPIIMLAIYTFVFSLIFQARWGTLLDTSKTQFAIVLFVGLLLQGFFAEVINRSPGLILAHANYVKKIIFPLEILPIIIISTALFHCLINLIVLLAAFVLFNGYLQWTLIFIPLILLPFVLFTLGCSWVLVSLGVFLRDVGQTVAILSTVLLFLSPVFYPISAVPEQFRVFIMVNPLTFVIEQTREILLFGHLPNWLGLGLYTGIATVTTWLGYSFFQKSRKGFADVL